MPLYREISLTGTSVAEMRDEIGAISPDVIHIATEGPLGWTARRVCLREGLRFTNPGVKF